MLSRRSFLGLTSLALLGGGRAHASEFWDEVKTPGLRLWRQDMTRARAALRARRLAQAREAASAAIRRLPERAEGWLVRGLAAGEAGELDAARDDLLHARRLDPAALDEPAEGARAGELLARAGSHAEAAEVLGRVLARARSGQARHGLYGLYGDALSVLGPERLEDAERAYREALRDSPHDPRASLGLALVLVRGRDDDLEWRELARRIAALGRLDALLLGLEVPEPERAARRAVVLEALGDAAGARTAWTAASRDGAWAEDARRRLGP
ncbi:MAG: tetratricopeptide repeat protein [Sandaracinus sp.]|nr:tetratricopeptide repeat protein [Sandaracinus sp.]MCB9621644.1 tetratricopeptide repeat protein [Sandaracinus sp.]MCB9622096.1 tetratricopeptide repeat protein [Sandaracinus sp.]MCB9630613.1 tetratricopeptide repeat protein [Sandaracinus sp.]